MRARLFGLQPRTSNQLPANSPHIFVFYWISVPIPFTSRFCSLFQFTLPFPRPGFGTGLLSATGPPLPFWSVSPMNFGYHYSCPVCSCPLHYCWITTSDPLAEPPSHIHPIETLYYTCQSQHSSNFSECLLGACERPKSSLIANNLSQSTDGFRPRDLLTVFCQRLWLQGCIIPRSTKIFKGVIELVAPEVPRGVSHSTFC